MNKEEIAETLRNEVGHLEMDIQKVQERCERLKAFVLNLENEIAPPKTQNPSPQSKLRKAIDSVFGEKPKRPKR